MKLLRTSPTIFISLICGKKWVLKQKWIVEALSSWRQVMLLTILLCYWHRVAQLVKKTNCLTFYPVVWIQFLSCEFSKNDEEMILFWVTLKESQIFFLFCKERIVFLLGKNTRTHKKRTCLTFYYINMYIISQNKIFFPLKINDNSFIADWCGGTPLILDGKLYILIFMEKLIEIKGRFGYADS